MNGNCTTRKKNKSYQYADALLLLAFRDNKPVGRIMGIINKRYNSIHDEQHGRFCFMECYNDREVFHALIARVEEWLRKNGMQKIVGPLGFSDKDPAGLPDRGFRVSTVYDKRQQFALYATVCWKVRAL